MKLELEYTPRDPAEFPNWTFPNLDFEYEAETKSVWMYYKADGPPFYTFQTLTDMADVRESLKALHASSLAATFPVRYFVMASRKPGVFNLGGDLAMFSEAIVKRERAVLRGYAHACIDIVHGLATVFGLPIVSISAVTGQALGGGFEAALAEDFVLVDETARIGVPEVAFNSFPGMGAVSLLSRRLGMAKAEEIIASGRVYTGQEMYDIGVADLIASKGAAHDRARQWMADGGEDRYQRRLALAQARRRLFPVSHAELIRITDIWADCSIDVTPHDVRYMQRLVAAQRKLQAEG